MSGTLAIVGSAPRPGCPTGFACPDGITLAWGLILVEIQHRRPDRITSGGAAGVDTLAEKAAHRERIEPLIHRPTVKRWAGKGGFQERNRLIVASCTHLLRISCTESRTYGSGWTADEAQRAGKPVRRVTIAPDGLITDHGWVNVP